MQSIPLDKNNIRIPNCIPYLQKTQRMKKLNQLPRAEPIHSSQSVKTEGAPPANEAALKNPKIADIFQSAKLPAFTALHLPFREKTPPEVDRSFSPFAMSLLKRTEVEYGVEEEEDDLDDFPNGEDFEALANSSPEDEMGQAVHSILEGDDYGLNPETGLFDSAEILKELEQLQHTVGADPEDHVPASQKPTQVQKDSTWNSGSSGFSGSSGISAPLANIPSTQPVSKMEKGTIKPFRAIDVVPREQ